MNILQQVYDSFMKSRVATSGTCHEPFAAGCMFMARQ